MLWSGKLQPHCDACKHWQEFNHRSVQEGLECLRRIKPFNDNYCLKTEETSRNGGYWYCTILRFLYLHLLLWNLVKLDTHWWYLTSLYQFWWIASLCMVLLHMEKTSFGEHLEWVINRSFLLCQGGDDWNDSPQTKEQTDASLLSKQEAAVRRERAMAYAFSHQVLHIFDIWILEIDFFYYLAF